MTDTRRERTILLLQSRTAWHPGIRSQFATFGALPGEKATRRETCSVCLGDCEVPSRAGPVPCERCNARGSYLVDAYTGYRSTDEGPWKGAAAKTAVEKRRQDDATIARLAQQVAPPRSQADLIHEANSNPEPWERQREAHHRHGSYRELTLALEWLSGTAPNLWQLVLWVFELDMVRVTPPALLRDALLGVDALAERLPDPIRVPPWLMPATGAARRVAAKEAA